MKKTVRFLIKLVVTPFMILYMPFIFVVWIGCGLTEWAKESETRPFGTIMLKNFRVLNECFNPWFWF